MSASMPAKERVLLAFQHKEADRVPLYSEARNVPFIEKMSGRKLRGTVEEMQVITADAYAKAGIDMMRTLMTPRWEVVKGEEFDVQWNGYLNWKVGGERRFTYDEAIERLKARWCGEPTTDAKTEAVQRIKEVNRIQAIFGDRALFLPIVPMSNLESVYHSVGIENFSLMMYDRPELIDEALERVTIRGMEMAAVMNDIYDGPIIHSGDDLGMKGKTLFSPAWLRAHVFPRMKRVAGVIKAGGKYLNFHSCGNVTAVVPDLIDVGIDALNPIEITAGMDLREMKEVYGDKLVLVGNANANIIQMGTPEEVRAEVRRCLDDAAAGGGYMLCGGLTSVSPVENFEAYFDEAASYQGWRTG